MPVNEVKKVRMKCDRSDTDVLSRTRREPVTDREGRGRRGKV
jgi:hypothetical protein